MSKKTDPKASVSSPSTSVSSPSDTASSDSAETSLATPAFVAPVKISSLKEPLGERLAKRDPSELEAVCHAKLDALVSLVDDPTLPDDLRTSLRLLVDQVAQNKPGMEEGTDRWRIQRVKVAQPTTTSISKPDAARNGDLYTTGGMLLPRPFAMIPIYFSQENVLFPEGAKVPQCQAPDSRLGQPYGLCQQCPHLPLGLQNGGKGEQKVTDCNRQRAVVVLAADLSQIFMIQFAKTSFKAGSALQSLAGTRPAPWHQTYHLETAKGEGTVGQYWVFRVAPTGKDVDAPTRRIAQAFCELYTAERERHLGEWYRGAAAAPATAAAAESTFQSSKLDAGLAGDKESFDLGDDGTVTPTGTSASVRSSARPM